MLRKVEISLLGRYSASTPSRLGHINYVDYVRSPTRGGTALSLGCMSSKCSNQLS